MDGKKIGKGLLWKLMERFGVQGVQFILFNDPATTEIYT